MKRRRTLFIAFVVLLMAAAVWVIGELVLEAGSDRPEGVYEAAEEATAPLARQRGQFSSLGEPLRRAPARAGEAEPSPEALAERYARRAYPGAPPFIPHEVESEMAGDSGCLGCHRWGGWSPGFEADAPPTPHPELVACRQCHVARRSEDLFRVTDWQRPEPPRLGLAALPGSPPPIPHPLQMRESCLACHAGPAAEVPTDHPERVGCLQCHVAQAVTGGWERPGGGGS